MHGSPTSWRLRGRSKKQSMASACWSDWSTTAHMQFMSLVKKLDYSTIQVELQATETIDKLVYGLEKLTGKIDNVKRAGV